MKKTLSAALAFSLLINMTGCSAFRSPTQIVSVTTDHADSEIFINGTMVGRGTASTAVKRNENIQLMVKKDGYIPVQRSIGHGLNTTGVLDIIGGAIFLIPLFGLLAAGSQSVDETNLNVMLMKA